MYLLQLIVVEIVLMLLLVEVEGDSSHIVETAAAVIVASPLNSTVVHTQSRYVFTHTIQFRPVDDGEEQMSGHHRHE